MRAMFGSNVMQGDKSDEEGSNCIGPIMSALLSQLKEPLILMLLGSAGLSIFLGNTADAISIGIALLIVSLVAAVQEYRSEQALEKLANLVPHTCTVMRDGRVMDGFLARELVVGDLVLLATGEYVYKQNEIRLSPNVAPYLTVSSPSVGYLRIVVSWIRSS